MSHRWMYQFSSLSTPSGLPPPNFWVLVSIRRLTILCEIINSLLFAQTHFQEEYFGFHATLWTVKRMAYKCWLSEKFPSPDELLTFRPEVHAEAVEHVIFIHFLLQACEQSPCESNCKTCKQPHRVYFVSAEMGLLVRRTTIQYCFIEDPGVCQGNNFAVISNRVE